jgi:class 3 adenylate cyclase
VLISAETTTNPLSLDTGSGQDQCLLFADVVGSTKLYETLGDERALEIISRIVDMASAVVGEHGGRVVKTIGDEIMAVFPTASQCARAIRAIMEQTERQSQEARRTLELRAGFQCGSVVEEDGDVFGDTVNVAARLIKLAKPGQIVTSESTARLLDAELQGETRCLFSIPVKGKTGEITLHELFWKEDNTGETRLIQPRRAGASELLLWHHDGSLGVSAGTPVLTIGRQGDNTLVIDDSRVSRHHARIELRRDKFILTDESTNGTYIQSGNQASPVFLLREETVLQGHGTISVGHPLSGASSESVEELLLRFQVC